MPDLALSHRTPDLSRRRTRARVATLAVPAAVALSLALLGGLWPRGAQPSTRSAVLASRAPVAPLMFAHARGAAAKGAKGNAAAKVARGKVSGIPTDPLWEQAWSLRALHLPDVWRQLGGQGAPIVVAVVDTGVDAGQPDLQGALVQGYDATGTGDAGDANGHGTLTAGVIAARSNNGVGVAGVCPQCVVMPVKVLGADGRGTTPAIAEGIRWAVDHGAAVINMSFVIDGRTDEIADAVSYAHAHGVVLVAAAGNAGASAPTYPSAEPFVIGVAATQPDASLYEWSDRGPWVRISAPGCSPSTALGSEYAIFCGTSSASAVVSGVVALALSAVPAATTAEVDRALESSAVPLAGGGVALGSLDAQALVAALGASVRQRTSVDQAAPFVAPRVLRDFDPGP